MLWDLFVVFLVSLSNSFAIEGVSWLFIYRTDEYQRVKQRSERLTVKLAAKEEELKLIVSSHADKKRRKEHERIEAELKSANSSMSGMKFKSTIATMFMMVAVYAVLSSWYDGVVLAQLPFEPVWMFRSLAHRGLIGNDYTQCSFFFFYVLCQLSVRSNVQKYFGRTPPNFTGFGQAGAADKKW
mmetsp:Transcript_39203/g.98810  ORF Transcript_39203/g.98810 Transcript_39203/m.98810 type:complete len:184 (+) Transcript_39203:152-703(+)|eukprot:CAMPEP_0177661050 /NCGR_PEP_ID=MMETSP0447-20121125/18424_1 /TAXON_ID=0 /ORGANISM="Stygamoeba regulata, Strain BSH-02190019" /LENGTH=183 /DNA_ID=CAMNT_0019166271 /DNA_START=147 /DNA_END=698 /DNA_ORIENTATION=+